MIHKKTLKPNVLTQIDSGESRYIKLINCETDLTMIVYAADGGEVIKTEVRSGFDVTLPEFQSIVLQSDQEQAVEVWASKNKLGYEAPTKGSNSNSSVLIKHYGGSQKVLPFERNRVAITLFSDSEPFWYGGEGVTVENGIPVQAGVTQKIEGAGELHLAIQQAPQYSISGEFNKIPSQEFTKSLVEGVEVVGGELFTVYSSDSFKISNSGVEKFDVSGVVGFSGGSGLLQYVTLADAYVGGVRINANALGINVQFYDVTSRGEKTLVGGKINNVAAVWQLDNDSKTLNLISDDNLAQGVVRGIYLSENDVAYCFCQSVSGDGVLYVLSNGQMTEVTGSRTEGMGLTFSEDDEYICMSTNRGLLMVDKSQNNSVDVLPNGALAAYITSDKWVYADRGTIYESTNKGQAWSSSFVYDGSFGNSTYRPSLGPLGGDSYFISGLTGLTTPAEFLELKQDKLTINPRAKIRMLKEVV